MTRFTTTSAICIIGILIGMTLVSTGCQHLRRRESPPSPTVEPTPLEFVPEYSSPNQPTPLSAPALPPADDLPIPPGPESAAHMDLDGPRLGGFTPPPSFEELPDLAIPEANLDDPSAPRIRRTSNDDLEIVATEDLELPTEEPVLLKDFLKSKPQNAVQLDADLFRLELEADRLELPVISMPPQVDVHSSSVAQPIVVEPLATITPHRAIANWPTEGPPQDMIIVPGPSVQKWAVEPAMPSRSTPPRRLAADNSDWAGPTIE